VLGMLGGIGYSVASADAISREVYAGERVQATIRRLLENPEPTRDEVREAMVSDGSFRRTLNRLMHGEIWDRIETLRPDFVEIPLLVEACLHPRFRRVWVVICGEEDQRKRLFERLGDRVQVDQLLATQLPTAVKAQFADRIVRTNGEPEDVLAFVQSIASADCAR
jgi:dephospho-CoA kinase